MATPSPDVLAATSAHTKMERAIMQKLTEQGHKPVTTWAVGCSIFITMATQAEAAEVVEVFRLVFRLVSWVKSVRLMQDDLEDGGAFYAEVSI